MEILTTKTKKDGKFLRRPTGDFDFSKFSRRQIRELISGMRKTMKAANGVGLSANQVGFDFKMFIAEPPSERGASKFYAVFNPVIEKKSGEMTEAEEGCLSVLRTYGKVRRPDRILLSGLDKDGKKIKIKAWGLLARIFQHEVDHLNGILFVDKAHDVYEITFEKGEGKEAGSN